MNLPYYNSNRKTNQYGIIDDRDCDLDEYAMHYSRFQKYVISTGKIKTPKKRKGFTKEERIFILEEKGQICSVCSTHLDLQIHHIDGDPSNNELINLQLLCYRCHKKTHSKKVVMRT